MYEKNMHSANAGVWGSTMRAQTQPSRREKGSGEYAMGHNPFARERNLSVPIRLQI